MLNLKTIQVYSSALAKNLKLNIKNVLINTNYYNKKLNSITPDRIFYTPGRNLIAPLTKYNISNYEIVESKIDWSYKKNFQEFEKLHNFSWLTNLDRKNKKIIIQKIISDWLENYSNYKKLVWNLEIVSDRIIFWLSNLDIILTDGREQFKKTLYASLIKQSNFVFKNIQDVNSTPNKIKACAAVILSGLVFNEISENSKKTLKELKKIIFNDFDKFGCPKTKNPEDIYRCLKYLILTREWLKESQSSIPDYLEEIIFKCGKSYKFFSNTSKTIPLFNGSSYFSCKDYDKYLKNLSYNFEKNECENTAGILKIKSKNSVVFYNVGDPPSTKHLKNYQAGALSFEIISGKDKIITNSGYNKKLSPKISLLSCSTAAHSTLCLNETSSCIFEKSKLIRKIYGNYLKSGLKISKIDEQNTNEYFEYTFSHNGYEKKYGCKHYRTIRVFKNENKIEGLDKLEKTRKKNNNLYFAIRFYFDSGAKISKTKGGNSLILEFPSGQGWMLKSPSHKFGSEKGLFFGNEEKIIQNECGFIAGNFDVEKKVIEWNINKIS